ncbi:MAG TPA: HEAT repeat domain-containing protein [Oculatellaceae cyanobacterium]
MSERLMDMKEIDNSKFPFRYLLRWSWPDHIEQLIRQLMWLWMTEISQESPSNVDIATADLLAMRTMWLIAVHPESPGAMLQVIAEQCSEGFVERVAENQNTWPSTLRQLAHHKSSRVRAAVAQNSNTPSDVLFALACDESADVRYMIADGIQGDVKLLEQMLEDENPYVVSRAKRSLARLFPPEPAKMPLRKQSTQKSDLKKVAEA